MEEKPRNKKRGIKLILAIVASIINFASLVFCITLYGGLALIKIPQIFFGEEFHGIVMVPIFVLSLFVAFSFSRYVFRGIMTH